MSTVKRAYRYRFSPTDEQKQQLARTFGCCRFVYNWALALRQQTYQQTGHGLPYTSLDAQMTVLRHQEQTAFLSEVSCVPLQQSLRHLMRAYTNFFEGRADFPTFKKRQGPQSATYTRSAFSYKGGMLTLAKMEEPLAIRWSRPLPDGANPSSVTVSRDQTGRYFVSLLVEEDITPLPKKEKLIGIDLGLKTMAATSDGQTFPNPKYAARDEKKLARAQRRLSRTQKGSKNREKQRRRVAKIHARIADKRRHHQHQLSTHLIRENQTIVVESLAVKNMMQHPTLAKAIADVGWGEFVRQLEYKAAWYGRTLIKIDRFYPSSKTCSCCRHVIDSLDLDVREWTCSMCGTHHDRDQNAAKSILAEGLRWLAEEHAATACGGAIRPNLNGNQGRHAPVKQEPGLVTAPGNPPVSTVGIC
ncbi:transposase [Ktedonobacter sp. SOSP1-85]|uniref:RNA-guided endonuclease InsQ/TnpB family protein n=1 Tax=Ktedonobacter sp. SOSP1-85 TaxID=2778367 RepID=UPI0019155B6C|nr:RNA-guided endonuclease TnpB family protein [Ktedonobacter sp. SOSP1-85]GHO79565.1 transposase [Ktedonobacter sp. SOSP1-85]